MPYREARTAVVPRTWPSFDKMLIVHTNSSLLFIARNLPEKSQAVGVRVRVFTVKNMAIEPFCRRWAKAYKYTSASREKI